MMLHRYQLVVLLLMLGIAVPSYADWRRFRGPNGTGIATTADVPSDWSDATDANIAWRVDLPGRGLSGPILIEDRVFLTCCSGTRQDRLHTLCFDQQTGELAWERQLWATGRTMTHPSISTAASTPASDGKHVFVYFSSNDLACYDLDGNLQWLRGLTLEYANASNSLGLAASPVVVGETLVIPIENESESIAVGLDTNTGETRWQLDRPESGNWTTPVVLFEGGENPAIGLQSGSMLSVHDPRTGEERWRYDQGCSTIPSSVAGDQVLYIPSKGLTALQYTRGASSVLWQNNRLSPSTATPLVHDNVIFTISGSILRCADTASGQVMGQLRLKGKFSSSPVLVDGRLYAFNEDGEGFVVELDGRRLRQVGGGELDGSILCSPAVADGAIFVRSDRHLWKIADTSDE